MPETHKLFEGLFQSLDHSYILSEMISETFLKVCGLNLIVQRKQRPRILPVGGYLTLICRVDN